MRQLIKMQEKPPAIAGMIGKQFRQLGVARTLIDQGKGQSELMRICNLRDYPAKKIMTSARRFSSRFFTVALELIMEADYSLKSSQDDPVRLLELLVLRLAQEAHNV